MFSNKLKQVTLLFLFLLWARLCWGWGLLHKIKNIIYIHFMVKELLHPPFYINLIQFISTNSEIQIYVFLFHCMVAGLLPPTSLPTSFLLSLCLPSWSKNRLGWEPAETSESRETTWVKHLSIWDSHSERSVSNGKKKEESNQSVETTER